MDASSKAKETARKIPHSSIILSMLSPDDPRLAPFFSLKAQKETFIVEGPKVIEKLLQSSLEVEIFLALDHYHKEFKHLLSKKKIPHLLTADKQLIDNLAGYRMHHGALALVKTPPSTPLSELKAPILILNRLANAENVGAILRNCAAFGIKSLIFDSFTSPPYLRRTVRVSMGTLFDLNIHITQDLTKTLKELSLPIIGAALSSQAIPLPQFTFPKEFALIIGSEGTGIDPEIKALCNTLISIPIDPSVDSLNAAAATAILAYHANATKN